MTPITAVSPTPKRPLAKLDPQNEAIGWYFRHGMPLHRVAALEGCIDYLMSHCDMSEQRAEVAAIQAYGEVNSVSQCAWIDADLTTAHVVVLRTLQGRSVMFTPADLMAVLSQAERDGRHRVVDVGVHTDGALSH